MKTNKSYSCANIDVKREGAELAIGFGNEHACAENRYGSEVKDSISP